MRFLLYSGQRLRKNVNHYITLAFFLCLFCITQLASAQTGAGSIQGTVTDTTGAAIPNAHVFVKNLATGVRAETTSSGVGFYQIPNLFTGKYSVRIVMEGMKIYNTSIEVLVGQKVVIDPVLSPGAVTQEVTVNADAVQLVDTESGTLATVLENKSIDQIPMNGRLLLTLTNLSSPGMEDGGQKVNGLAHEGTAYLIDGVSTLSTIGGGMQSTMTQLIDPDSVQEVRVETGNSSAQFSMPSTAIVSTKSGTNALHGALFETARNNAFGVARKIEDPVNYQAPHLVRNEFGFSAGGPIIIPHLYNGKDKSFWFFAYERYSLASTATALASVPTAAMRQGDFSGLVNSAGVLQVLYNPATTTSNTACAVPNSTKTANNPYCRTPYANNTIPSSMMSPLAKIYYQMLPTPTTTDNPLVKTNVSATNESFQVVPQWTFRLDHVFNEKNRAYLRYSHTYSNINSSGGPRSYAVGDIPAGAAFGYGNNPSSQFLTGIGYTHIFSPSFYAETIVTQQWYMYKQLTGFAPDKNYETTLGLPNNFGEAGFPYIGNGSLMFSMGTSQQNNVQDGNIITTLAENLNKVHGKHQLQFGGDIRHERDADKPNGVADAVAFGANPLALYDPSSKASYTAYASTGYADASMFVGSASSYNVNLQPPHVHYHAWQVGAYVQDNIHVTRRLTANIGLRYEARPALWTKDGLANSFDFKTDSMVLGTTTDDLIAKGYTTQAIINNDKRIGIKFETAQQAGMPEKLMRDYNLNFFPRVGLSYQPFGGRFGTVLRGSYGRYAYANPIEDYANKPERNNPFNASYTTSYATANQAVDSLPNEYLRYNGPSVFPVAGKNSASVVDSTSITAINPGVAIYSVDPNWAPTFVTETNFTVEQPLKGHSVVRASYVWTHASNLDVTMMYNHQPTLYQWEMATGTVQPTGGAAVIGTSQQNTYSTTAMGPYDQTTWGNNTWMTRAGWSNYNALQVNYQRLYHHGYAYQLTYAFSKAMRAGGNQVDGNMVVYPRANYPGVMGSIGSMTSPYGSTVYAGIAPPSAPPNTPTWAGYHDLIKYAQYQQDSSQPTMHIRFNWVVDLPVGRNKKFFSHANRLVDEIIGGFQLAGSGNIFADLVQTTSLTNWGATSELKIYKHKYPLVDCTSNSNCYKEYLWFNGYQGPSKVSGNSYGTCTSGCITGMPSDYQPNQAPIDNTPSTTNYQTNNVQVALANGSVQTVAYDAGPIGANYLQKTWIHGPVNWPINASLFKVFPIKGRVGMRVNLDAFNVFNMPGENDPGTGGLQKFTTSNNAARQLQITARLTF